MVRTAEFDEHAARYDAWFERHPTVFLSELLAVRAMFPCGGRRVEIGVGTGRFAQPLGISLGVEPSASMAAIARTRGIDVLAGTAESLPLADASMDAVLSVTTICFVDDVAAMFGEMWRILAPGGTATVAFLDSQSLAAPDWLPSCRASSFYREARFVGAADVREQFARAGFTEIEAIQTLARPRTDSGDIEPAEPGFGHGFFVAMRGQRPRE